jgi:type IV secretory pathway VirB10-like protein
MATDNPHAPPDAPRTEAPRVRDQRVPPRGVLPRQMQTWLMVGIALVIVLIILITGRTQPPARPGSAARPIDPALAPADRIRAYEQQLAEEESRQHDAATLAEAGRATAARVPGRGSGTSVTDDARRRDEQSLFADNVALSRRPRDQQPLAATASASMVPNAASETAPSNDLALLDRALARISAPRPAGLEAVPPAPIAAPPTAAPPGRTDEPEASEYRDENPAPGARLRLLEGTVIEAVLVNRLDGTFAGPVVGLVTTPVYAHDLQAILIPAGARVLGAASPVQSWGESRLAVSFHRLVMPDGHTYRLTLFKGLNQIGEAGLRDRVNRHYLQIFGASLAIGALSGLAQFGSRSVGTYEFGTEYRQAMGSSLATSASRVLDRYLNVLPTITIREGYRLKVYLTNDLELPRYAPSSGGAR